jgi:hypothetical protein
MEASSIPDKSSLSNFGTLIKPIKEEIRKN